MLREGGGVRVCQPLWSTLVPHFPLNKHKKNIQAGPKNWKCCRIIYWVRRYFSAASYTPNQAAMFVAVKHPFIRSRSALAALFWSSWWLQICFRHYSFEFWPPTASLFSKKCPIAPVILRLASEKYKQNRSFVPFGLRRLFHHFVEFSEKNCSLEDFLWGGGRLYSSDCGVFVLYVAGGFGCSPRWR